jgi:hypothetical protein
MARAYKRIDKTTDETRKNGDRVRQYTVHNAADDSVIGVVTEHWHASAFDADANGKRTVDMSLYKNSTELNRRSFTAKTSDGKNVDSGATLARTVANVRIAVLGK